MYLSERIIPPCITYWRRDGIGGEEGGGRFWSELDWIKRKQENYVVTRQGLWKQKLYKVEKGTDVIVLKADDRDNP